MSDLQTLKKYIIKKKESILAEKEKEWIVLANLGQAVHDSGNGTGLAEEFGRAVVKSTKEIHELEDSLQQLSIAEKRGAVISGEHKSLNVELRNLKNQTQDGLEELAQKAWDFMKFGRSIEGLEEAMEELVEAEKRLNDVEDAVSRNERLHGNLGGSILSKGRALFLTGRHRTATASLERLWGSIGSKIYATIDMDKFDGTSVEVAARKLKTIDARKLEIQERLLSLATEKKNLDADMDTMPGKGNIRRRMAWMEKMIHDDRIALREAFKDLGKAWLDAGEKKTLNLDVEQCKNEWDEVCKQIHILEADKHSLESHCEYQETETARDKQDIRVQNLDAKVKKMHVQLKEAKKELSTLDKKLTKLKESLPALPQLTQDD